MWPYQRKKPILPSAELLLEEFFSEKSIPFLCEKYDRCPETIWNKFRENRAGYKKAKKIVKAQTKEQQQVERINKPYRHAKYGFTVEELLEEYISEMSVKVLGKKYNITKERIRQLLSRKPKEYRQARKIVFEKKRKIQYSQFMELVKSYGRIPHREEILQHSLQLASLYYPFRRQAEKEGYVWLKNEKPTDEKKEKMLAHLKELAMLLKHTPSLREITAAGQYNGHLYYYFFDSLSHAQKMAGLVPNKRGGQSPPEKNN